MEGLLGKDRHTRKVAKYEVCRGLCEQCPWGTYWQIYDAADEYSGHLLKSLTGELTQLVPCGGNTPGCFTNRFADILVKRICVHENDSVVKHAVTVFTCDEMLQKWLSKSVSVYSIIQGLEKTPSLFCAKTDVDRISSFLAQFVTSSKESSNFVAYALNEAKPYFPISFCYLQTVTQLDMDSMDISFLLECFHVYISARVESFEAILRPSLFKLITQTLLKPEIVALAAVSENQDLVVGNLLALIFHVCSPTVDLSSLRPLTVSFVLDYLRRDTVDISVSFPALMGARLVLGAENGSVIQQVRECFTEVRDRSYISTAYKETLVNICIAFQDDLSTEEISCVIDFSSLAILKRFRRCSINEQIVPELTTLLDKAEEGSLTTDSDIYRLVYLLTAVARANSLIAVNPSVLKQIRSLTPRRVSPDFECDMSRDELHDIFFSSKWKLLNRYVDLMSDEGDLIDDINSSDSSFLSEVLSFGKSLVLKKCVSDNFLRRFISEQAFAILAETANEHCVDLVFGIVLADPHSHVPEISQLIGKIIQLTTPHIGRCAVGPVVSFLKATGGEGAAVVELVANLIIHKEPFDELSVEGHAFTAGGSVIERSTAYVRVTTLITLKSLRNSQLVSALIGILLKKIKQYQDWVESKMAPQTPLPFTPFHQTQLRVYQAMCYLAPLVDRECFESVIEPDLFGPLLTWANQPDARDYLESLALYFLTKFKWPLGRLISTLKDFSLSSQAVASFVVIGGFLASYTQSDVPERTELMMALMPFLSSNIAYIRGLSQMWLFAANEKQLLPTEWMWLLNPILSFIRTNKESVQMRFKLRPVFALWEPIAAVESGEILSLCSSSGAMFRNSELVPSRVFIDAVREGVHDALQDNWFYTRDLQSLIDDAMAAQRATEQQTDVVSRVGNVNSQKKYNPPQLEMDDVARRCETELIVFTSLVEKVTNIAGLCRTAEVFGASKLVVPCMQILKDPHFSSMSVTADKWIAIEEVAERSVEKYLKAKKEEGYTVVCLEQTHDSVEIQEYSFPNPKTILVLGNEKNGVPVQFLPLMDVCVEIPQRGVIRSLNVHVSGAIAMWQYNRSRS